MAYVSYEDSWRSEIHNNASAKDRMQNIKFNEIRINLKMNDTSKKNKKRTTKLEPFDDTKCIEDRKIYPKQRFKKTQKKSKLLGNKNAKHPLGLERTIKQFVEEVLFEKTVKWTIQTLYDRGLFDNCDHADVVLKHYLFIDEVNNRRGADLEELVNDENVLQSFC